MTCNAEIRRSFPTREAAFDYLTSRGFLCVPRGWENGRWAATIQQARSAIQVFVWLRACAMA